MKLNRKQLRSIIRTVLLEQFKFPLRYNDNGFEIFSEDDDSVDEIWAAQGFDGDDERASIGGIDQDAEDEGMFYD